MSTDQTTRITSVEVMRYPRPRIVIETGEIRHESAQWRQWRTDGDTNLCVHVRGVVALEPDSGAVEFEPDSGGTEIKLGLEDETEVGLVWRCVVRGVDPTPEGDTIISFLADDFEVRTLKFDTSEPAHDVRSILN